jgi:hypothetical protein
VTDTPTERLGFTIGANASRADRARSADKLAILAIAVVVVA